tara:strand:- start:407 stop:643 length:237 start_codon:yes stop_codon:yes gene_type:complete
MKLLEIEIHNCSECPYLSYDSDYGMSYNSGYDCSKGGFRIATDHGSEQADMTKYMPDECPLKDFSEIREEKINEILKN